MKKKILTSLELNEHDLRIVQGAGNGHAESLTLLACEPGQGPDEASGRAKGIKQDKMRPGSKGIIASIPRRSFILKHLTLPSASQDELRKMIHLHLLSQLPYKEEEISWDWTVLETLPSGHTRIMAMVIANAARQRYEKMLAAKRIRPLKLTMSSFGLLGWHALHESGQRSPNERVHSIISVDAAQTEICFCDLDKLYFSRSFQLGSEQLSAGEGGRWGEEIRQTLAAYRKEHMGPPPERAKILSVPPLSPDLAQEIIRGIGMPAAVYDPLKDLPVKQSASAGSYPAGVSFAVGVGLIGNEFTQLGDFLSKDGLDRTTFRSRWLKRLLGGVVVLIAYASLVMVLSVGTFEQSRVLTLTQKRLAAIRPQFDAAKQRMRLLESLDKEWTARLPVMELIDELYRLMPEDMILLQLNVSELGNVTLNGIALSGAAVNLLQNQLVASPLFRGVTLQHAAKRMSAYGEMTDFSISAEIAPRSGERP